MGAANRQAEHNTLRALLFFAFFAPSRSSREKECLQLWTEESVSREGREGAKNAKIIGEFQALIRVCPHGYSPLFLVLLEMSHPKNSSAGLKAAP
jgi:hypothetical protein